MAVALVAPDRATDAHFQFHPWPYGDNQMHRNTNASTTAVTIILYAIIGAISASVVALVARAHYLFTGRSCTML